MIIWVNMILCDYGESSPFLAIPAVVGAGVIILAHNISI